MLFQRVVPTFAIEHRLTKLLIYAHVPKPIDNVAVEPVDAAGLHRPRRQKTG